MIPLPMLGGPVAGGPERKVGTERFGGQAAGARQSLNGSRGIAALRTALPAKIATLTAHSPRPAFTAWHASGGPACLVR